MGPPAQWMNPPHVAMEVCLAVEVPTILIFATVLEELGAVHTTTPVRAPTQPALYALATFLLQARIVI